MAKADSLISLPSTTTDNATTTTCKPVAVASPCQECKTQAFRYQCPRCSFRSCSLECCVAHKKRTGCNGKRDRTKFLPVARMNDDTMWNDYHFLEDVLGAVDRAKRTAGKNPQQQHSNNNKRFKPNLEGEEEKALERPHSMLQQMETLRDGGLQQQSSKEEVPRLPPDCWKRLSPKWRHFWQQARLRGVHLLLMPHGMQRRKANTSHAKKDVLYWKVEVRFHSQDSSVAPTTKARKMSEQANWLDELQAIIPEGEEYRWMMQKLPSPSNRSCYTEIPRKGTLQSVLKGTTIIEFPTLEAVPPERLKDFPKAIEEVVANEEEEEEEKEEVVAGIQEVEASTTKDPKDNDPTRKE